jgi:crotonobetainyl-CoA:carnitine CoA-transferase CaiB-like acyl-CoA transferase
MNKPLAGCRVLDLGIITAGAATSALLADLGAEVIKIESPAYRDPFRLWTAGEEGEDTELPRFFRMTNRNKLSLSLNLKEVEGRNVFLKLVAESDVVVENFSRGVLARLGIDFASLEAVNPRIILASISSQGETGPDRSYVSFGSTLEAMAGLASITGYPHGQPIVTGNAVNYPDQVVALFAAGAIAAAWQRSALERTGIHLDLSQRELTTYLCGDSSIRQDGLQGNASSFYALQDCFLAEDDAWIAISLTAEAAVEFGMLVQVRSLDAEALAAALSRWVRERNSVAAVAELRGVGVIAEVVRNALDALESVGQALQGMPDGDYVKGFPFRIEDIPLEIATPARRLGADSLDVLQRVGRMTSIETEALMSSGIVTVPPSAARLLPNGTERA